MPVAETVNVAAVPTFVARLAGCVTISGVAKIDVQERVSIAAKSRKRLLAACRTTRNRRYNIRIRVTVISIVAGGRYGKCGSYLESLVTNPRTCWRISLPIGRAMEYCTPASERSSAW